MKFYFADVAGEWGFVLALGGLFFYLEILPFVAGVGMICSFLFTQTSSSLKNLIIAFLFFLFGAAVAVIHVFVLYPYSGEKPTGSEYFSKLLPWLLSTGWLLAASIKFLKVRKKRFVSHASKRLL